MRCSARAPRDRTSRRTGAPCAVSWVGRWLRRVASWRGTPLQVRGGALIILHSCPPPPPMQVRGGGALAAPLLPHVRHGPLGHDQARQAAAAAKEAQPRARRAGATARHRPPSPMPSMPALCAPLPPSNAFLPRPPPSNSRAQLERKDLLPRADESVSCRRQYAALRARERAAAEARRYGEAAALKAEADAVQARIDADVGLGIFMDFDEFRRAAQTHLVIRGPSRHLKSRAHVSRVDPLASRCLQAGAGPLRRQGPRHQHGLRRLGRRLHLQRAHQGAHHARRRRHPAALAQPEGSRHPLRAVDAGP